VLPAGEMLRYDRTVPRKTIRMRSEVWCRVMLAAVTAILAATGARAADGIAGAWEGEYDCNQGTTGLTLTVAPPAHGQMLTVFYFYSSAEGGPVPEGCYEMSGTYDAKTGAADFTARRWLLRPDGYVTVDLHGEVDSDAATLDGVVDGPGCTEFHLHRSKAPRPLPPACQPRPVASLSLIAG
jgi:hypothetical protein